MASLAKSASQNTRYPPSKGEPAIPGSHTQPLPSAHGPHRRAQLWRGGAPNWCTQAQWGESST